MHMEDKLEKLNTPFGEIAVMIDGQPIDDEHNRDVQTWFVADPTLTL